MAIPFVLFAIACAGLAYVGLHKTATKKSLTHEEERQKIVA